MRAITLTLALLLSQALQLQEARASELSILARCGPSTGRSYYFEGGFVGPGQGGWRDDGISDGRLSIVLNEQGQLDIWSKDALNPLQSYLKEGYRVALVKFDEKSRTMILRASGPMFAESYQLRVNDLGVGTLVWTQSKITPAITKTAVMQAECGPQYAMKP